MFRIARRIRAIGKRLDAVEVALRQLRYSKDLDGGLTSADYMKGVILPKPRPCTPLKPGVWLL